MPLVRVPNGGSSIPPAGKTIRINTSGNTMIDNIKGTQQRFDWYGQGTFGVMLINADNLSGFSVTGGGMTSAVTVYVYEDGSAQMNGAMQAGCKLIVWAGFHSGSVPYVTYVLS